MSLIISVVTTIAGFFSPIQIEIKNPPIQILETEAKEVTLQVFDEVEFIPYEPEPKPFDIECLCVGWINRVMGVPIKGNARDIIPNSAPVKGGVVLFKYVEYHAAYILELFPGGMLVRDANFKPCEVTERFVYFSDKHIRGFWAS